MPPKKDDKAKKPEKDKKGKSKEPKKEGGKSGGSSKNLEKSEIPAPESAREEDVGVKQPLPVCVTHGRDLVLYCTSCEDPICENCAMTGPHNNQVAII